MVNDGLNRDPSEKEVPKYRVIPAKLLASIANSAWRQNLQMPSSHLPDDLQKKISENKMREPIRVLAVRHQTARVASTACLARVSAHLHFDGPTERMDLWHLPRKCQDQLCHRLSLLVTHLRLGRHDVRAPNARTARLDLRRQCRRGAAVICVARSNL